MLKQQHLSAWARCQITDQSISSAACTRYSASAATRTTMSALQTLHSSTLRCARFAPARSVHDADQVVDVVLAVAVLAALNVVQALLGEAAASGGQLEGPQKVGGLLEGGACCVNLVDQVLNADDVVLAQYLCMSQTFSPKAHACHPSWPHSNRHRCRQT